MKLLNSYFTFFLFQNVCRSLFEKDKLLFAFVLASKLQVDLGTMSPAELRFLLTGGVAMGDTPLPNPDSCWISDGKWGEMCRLASLPCPVWRTLPTHVRDNVAQWKQIYDAASPAQERLPEPWHDELTVFQRMLVLRTIRMDKIAPAMTAFVADTLGPRHAPFSTWLEGFNMPNYSPSNCSSGTATALFDSPHA
jgi:dynein heavy chain, axonemal